MTKVNGNGFHKRDLAYAISLIRQVCEVAGHNNIIEDTRLSFEEIGLLEAIQKHDDDAIYNWFAAAISYQGISDRVAAGYIEAHGCIDAADIRAALDRPHRRQAERHRGEANALQEAGPTLSRI